VLFPAIDETRESQWFSGRAFQGFLSSPFRGKNVETAGLLKNKQGSNSQDCKPVRGKGRKRFLVLKKWWGNKLEKGRHSNVCPGRTPGVAARWGNKKKNNACK